MDQRVEIQRNQIVRYVRCRGRKLLVRLLNVAAHSQAHPTKRIGYRWHNDRKCLRLLVVRPLLLNAVVAVPGKFDVPERRRFRALSRFMTHRNTKTARHPLVPVFRIRFRPRFRGSEAKLGRLAVTQATSITRCVCLAILSPVVEPFVGGSNTHGGCFRPCEVRIRAGGLREEGGRGGGTG